jgi:hypothetical protein
MAIPATYTFNPDLGEIMEEAFERAGAEFNNAAHIKSARRSLNLIALQWQNKGINLWTIEEKTITAATITKDLASYDIDIDTIGILDAVIRTDSADTSLQRDLSITRMSASTYSSISNKLTTGRPSQYWFHRNGVRSGTSGGTDVSSTVTFWPVPDTTNKYTFVYWRMRRISDVGSSLSNTVDVPDRFIPALVSALAYALCSKLPNSSIQEKLMMCEKLKAEQDNDWREATEEDREKSDLQIIPDRIY